MVMDRWKNCSICHTRKIKTYLWTRAVYEQSIGDGESTLPILHLDDIFKVELDGVTREVVLGAAESIFPILGVLVHQLRAVLQRLDPPDEPAHGQVQSVYKPLDLPYGVGSIV